MNYMKKSESSCTREDRIRIMKRIANRIVKASYDFLEGNKRGRKITEEFDLNEMKSKFPGKSDP